jgi:bifunctional DNase/RNase
MFIKAEIWTVGRTENGMAALLRLPSSSRCVPVYVDSGEAQAILTSLAGVKEQPPRLPEVLNSFSKAVSVKPESIEILKSGSPGQYRSIVHFAGNETRFSLNTRTPDALALALRAGIPIFLEENISEEDSISVSMAEPEMPFATQLSRLQEELSRRVHEEDYEQAAKIRDRIHQIEERIRSENES